MSYPNPSGSHLRKPRGSGYLSFKKLIPVITLRT
ncbi:hypothetical protein Tco_0675308, partial [Tanacetum coccineum]